VVGGFKEIKFLRGEIKATSGSDIFKFMPGGSITGSINGGIGTATLDFSALADAPNVSLVKVASVHGFFGSVKGTTDGATIANFDNVDQVVGSSSAGGSLNGLLSGPT